MIFSSEKQQLCFIVLNILENVVRKLLEEHLGWKIIYRQYLVELKFLRDKY